MLGPLLFSLYINDIKNITGNTDINLFADDTNIFCSSTSYDNLIKKCNETINKLENWVKCNKLTVNISKTHFVDFSKDKIKHTIRKILKYNSNVLNEKDHTKYLGIILQNDLKWNKHIETIMKKIKFHNILISQ